jgi:zinc protease
MAANRSQLPDVGADPSFAFPVVVRHSLANGLDVRTIEHHSVPVVTFVLQVDGGCGADPKGREGTAALTADMLDEGIGSLTAIDVSDALARIGAVYDVDVGADATVLTLTTLARFGERGATLLSDLATTPALRQDDFDRVRQLRLDRLRQLKDHPPAVAERAFLQLVYRDHPYGHLPIGSSAALREMRLDDVASFHAATYRPSRTTLVIAGALPHDEMLRLAQDAFGEWQPAPGPERTFAAAIEPNGFPAQLAVIARDDAAQSELRIGHLSAPRNTPDYHSLLVMNAVLGGQFVSRINLKLREEKGYTYGARTGFDWRRGIAPFVMQASVHTDATADAIRDAVGELAALRESRPPSDSEMSLARASLTRGYPRNFETAQQVARAVAQLALYDLRDTYFQEFMPKVNAVTSADVVRVASRYVDPTRLTTLVVGDYRRIAESIGGIGLGVPQLLASEA